MKARMLKYCSGEWTAHPRSPEFEDREAQLVLCFTSKEILERPPTFSIIKNKFPASQIVMCSTAGEIFHDSVQDNSLVVAALHFDSTVVRTALVNRADFNDSYNAGAELIKQFPKKELKYVLVLSDGSEVNGSRLVIGLNEAAENKILITGGLAGDGANFKSTLVGLNSDARPGNIVAIGFYGEKLIVTHGSQGGWDTFGPERLVTSSNDNKLFEIDNKNALSIYKKYLGPDADQLPGSALFFPLSVIMPGSNQPIVRTILSIDEKESSMTFAGDIPEKSKVRFMRVNFDKLTSAASAAAQETITNENKKPDFALLVSCVGRKLILGPRTEEEVEAVQDTLGDNTMLSGFYSYGEISPFNEGGDCRLHNQTMTITSFYELS